MTDSGPDIPDPEMNGRGDPPHEFACLETGIWDPGSGIHGQSTTDAAVPPRAVRPRRWTMPAILSASWFAVAGFWLGTAAGFTTGPGQVPDRPTPEARAVEFLVRAVPRWPRENHCFSCHNNGDAARALYEASHAGLRVPEEALAGTTAWLARPSGWDKNGGDGPFSDKRLARVAFTSALAAATRTGSNRDRAALRDAALRLARDQADDGSWMLEGEESPGSPAAYGRALATFLARESLATTDPARFRAVTARADDWLLRRELRTVADASVGLMAIAAAGSPASAARRREAIDLLSRAQADDGGWGPYVTSPPEPFDTALALLGLARCGDSSDPVRRMIARGRAFLIAGQREDGSWAETTRPPGGTSYAQRISTTGWATLALLATREAPSVLRGKSSHKSERNTTSD
jgi:hypothetical protein